jgi:prepilin-type N-terminal cleavage/methylation domain-containing protein
MSPLAKERYQQLGSQSGFSFIELLTVLIIIGIIAQMAITIFIDMRARSNDAAAVADGRNLLTVANINFVNLDNVYYGPDVANPPAISGAVGTSEATITLIPSFNWGIGAPREPIYELSNGVMAEISGVSPGIPGLGEISMELWHKNGTKIAGSPKKYRFEISETSDLYAFATY